MDFLSYCVIIWIQDSVFTLNLCQILIRDEYKEYEKLIQEDLKQVDDRLEEEEVNCFFTFLPVTEPFLSCDLHVWTCINNLKCTCEMQIDAAETIEEYESVDQK